MGNLVRACLGRDNSVLHFQWRTTLSRDLLMMFKVICYALFDHVATRNSHSEVSAGIRTRRSSAAYPASLLRLLYRRHVLKSKVDTQALSRCQTSSKEMSWGFSFENLVDVTSSIYGEKQVVASPRALEVLNRLNSEVQTLKSKLERQEEQVKRLTEELVSMQATAASRPLQSPTRQSRIDSSNVAEPETLLSDASEDSNPHLNICLSKGGHLVKLENVYMFQPVMSKPQKSIDEVRLCTSQDSGTGNANSEHHSTDLQSPVKVGTKDWWDPSLEERLSSEKVQSNARRISDCKCVDYLEREFVHDPATRTEIEADELDNLSMYSYESADTRDFQCVGTPKCPRRGDDFPDQMEWSSEESTKDLIMNRDPGLPWTNTDPDIATRHRPVQQQRYHELEEKLLKVLQSPRGEDSLQSVYSNFSSCSTSGSSSPRSTSSLSGQNHNGQSEGSLFWEPSRQTECSRTPQTLFTDKKFDTNFDFSTQTSKTYGASNSSKGHTHQSVNNESSGGEIDSRMPLHPRVTHQDERVVNPHLTREVFTKDSTRAQRRTYGISGESFRESIRESYGSSPAAEVGEDSRGELDLVDVALESFKVCKSGNIYTSDNRNRNRHEREDVETSTDSILYKESQGSSMSSGLNHLRRHSSFGPGTRQSRFAVEAARLSMRKQGHQRGGSF